MAFETLASLADGSQLPALWLKLMSQLSPSLNLCFFLHYIATGINSSAFFRFDATNVR